MWSVFCIRSFTKYVARPREIIFFVMLIGNMQNQLSCESTTGPHLSSSAQSSTLHGNNLETTKPYTESTPSSSDSAPRTTHEDRIVSLSANKENELSVDRISIVGEYSPRKSAQTGIQLAMIPIAVPKICSYPPLLANDCMYEPRWYYSAHFRSCLQFQSGSECDSNGNNFPTRDACQEICRTTAFVDMELRSMTKWRCGSPHIDRQQCRPSVWPTRRFYYDETLNRCTALDVGGCAASNAFASLDDCTFYCRQSDVVLEKVPPVACRLPKVRGFEICYNGQVRWHYNAQAQRCEWFMYSGCFGNWNNFLSYGDCQSVCGGADEYGPDTCSLPADTGTSFQYRTRYFYDKLARTCRAMDYSGFGGNANNFFVPEDCESECVV